MDKRGELLFLKASKAEKDGDWVTAALIYRTILKMAPNNARASQALARLRVEKAHLKQPSPPVPEDDMKAILALYNGGQMEAVVAKAEELIARYPQAVVLLSILGVAQGRLGRFDLAAEAFGRAIAIRPDYAEGHYNLGNALLELGRLDEAVASYRDALRVKPDYHSAHNNIGNALKEQGRLDEAIAAFRQALAVKPDYFEGHYNLGNTLREQGAFDDAVAAYRQALTLRPDNADAQNNLGNALREQGMWDEAIAAFRQVIAIRPDYAEGHYNLGNALMERDDPTEAVAAFQQAIALRPDYAEAHNNLADAFLEQGELERAAAACRQAIAIRPDYANAYNVLGNVLKEQFRAEESIAAYRQAVLLKPDYFDARVNLGNALAEQGHFDEAAANYRAVIAEDPDCAGAHHSMAIVHLHRGEFDEGWRLYDWRRQKTNAQAGRTFPQPLWLGEEDIRGKSVFIHHEQGLGDTIHFMRYAAMVRDRGAEATLSVQRPLLPLLEHAIPGVTVIGGQDVPARFDCHVPLMSLPLAFRTTLETVPADIPYLSADPERVRKWSERFGTSGFKIGVCWQGSTGKIDRGRSFPVARFAGIAGLPDVRLISLHKGAGEAQLATLPAGMRIELPGEDFDPEGAAFLDSAAVISLCDLVITSDTAVAHLAGALGVPTWVMLQYVPDWRWLRDREDSPWYPGMRLFRQPRPGDWDTPFERLQQHLRELLEHQQSSGEPVAP